MLLKGERCSQRQISKNYSLSKSGTMKKYYLLQQREPEGEQMSEREKERERERERENLSMAERKE